MVSNRRRAAPFFRLPISAAMQTAIRRVTLMLPAELHDRLSEQAREAERSLAAEIRLAVREYVRSEPAKRETTRETT